MRQFPIDDRITDWVVDSRHEPLTSAFHMITALGDTLTLTLVVICVFVLAWVANRIDLASLIVVGSISGYLVMVTLKVLFNRNRPPVADRLIDVGQSSFPSGHAMLSTVIFGLTAVILYRMYPKVRARPLVLIWLPVLAVLIGISRVYLGVHWASDVFFGWVFGVVWVVMCLVGLAQIVRRPAILRLGSKDVRTALMRTRPRRSETTGDADQDASSPS